MATVSLSGSSSFEGTTTSDPNFLSWTISLDAPATGIIDVGYRLLAGTGSVARFDSGLGNTDAYGTAESFVRFAPGETTKTVSYRLDGDNVDEPDEAVVLEMFNPEGAVLAGGAPVLRSTGFILDDDGTGTNLAAFVSRPVLVEGDSGQSQASFEVTLSRPAPSAFTVSYATVDGSAVAGEDYVATSGTLSFVAGQTTAGVTVPVRGDTRLEPTEMFTLDVSRPAPAAAISLGGEGNDRLEGSFGNDVLRGNGGDDRLNGGLGFDLMVGGDGNDTLDALDGFDNLVGGNGNDLLNGNAGNDSLSGGSGTDRLNGGIGADFLGGNGADQIDGGAGADNLFGNAGVDRIDGGAGNDLLSGGIGTDEFVFTAGNGQDTVVDFGTVDRLSLDAGLVGNAGLGQFERTVGGDLALNFGGGDLLVLVGYDDLSQISGQIDLI